MKLGYNTNGFAHHRLEDALVILADLGYQSVALTIDYHALDPFDNASPAQVDRVRSLLQKHRLGCVIETGARFLLDPRRKHRPTLLERTPEERQRRVEFLRSAVRLAHELQADAVSFWSGAVPDVATEDSVWLRLVDGCRRVLELAEKYKVRLAFEPEPGMFIDTMAKYRDLFQQINHPLFGLTLDMGHLHCLGETPIAPHIEEWREVLWNVHLEDMKRGVHDHLMFGEGEMDFAEILGSLHKMEYTGGIHVELSRHSHDAVNTARRARAFLDATSG